VVLLEWCVSDRVLFVGIGILMQRCVESECCVELFRLCGFESVQVRGFGLLLVWCVVVVNVYFLVFRLHGFVL